MAHRTLIGGTGYTVTGGTDLIDGTARSRTAGRTLVDGTAYAIGFGGLDADFSKNSWRTIIAACQNKQVPDTWNVGDSCMMAFGKKNYQIDIIGKNHDDYADGSGKAPLTFQMHTCYATEYKMNNSGSNTGGWADCLLRTTGGFKIIKSKMPAEVVAALKAVTKKTTAGGHRHDGGHAVPAVGDRGTGHTDILLSRRGHAVRVLQDGGQPEEKPCMVFALAETQQHDLL